MGREAYPQPVVANLLIPAAFLHGSLCPEKGRQGSLERPAVAQHAGQEAGD